MMCYGAHHDGGKHCKRFWERCFECHVPVKAKNDHSENCGAKNWLQSERYIEIYAKTAAIRATFSFQKAIKYLLYGEWVEAKSEMEVFSGMADVIFQFTSQSKLVLKTTGFSRIRLPVVVKENGPNGVYTERMVFMTSHDRTLVGANSSRVVNESNVLTEFEHNTPLVLLLSGDLAKMTVEVYSGGNIHKYEVGVVANGKKFLIPDQLDVKSKNFAPRTFDADIPLKKIKY